MRMLVKNAQPIWYANYSSKTELTDEYDNATGEYEITYTAPVKTYANIRAVDSDAEIQMFGIEAKNTIRIVAEKSKLPISETSILWYGKDPASQTDTQPGDYNYRIVGAPPTRIDALYYAVRVEVSGEPKEPEPPEPELPGEDDEP